MNFKPLNTVHILVFWYIVNCLIYGQKTVKQSLADSHNLSPVEQILSEEHLFSEQEYSTTSYNLGWFYRGEGGVYLLQLVTTSYNRDLFVKWTEIKGKLFIYFKTSFFCIKNVYLKCICFINGNRKKFALHFKKQNKNQSFRFEMEY